MAARAVGCDGGADDGFKRAGEGGRRDVGSWRVGGGILWPDHDESGQRQSGSWRRLLGSAHEPPRHPPAHPPITQITTAALQATARTSTSHRKHMSNVQGKRVLIFQGHLVRNRANTSNQRTHPHDKPSARPNLCKCCCMFSEQPSQSDRCEKLLAAQMCSQKERTPIRNESRDDGKTP